MLEVPLSIHPLMRLAAAADGQDDDMSICYEIRTFTQEWWILNDGILEIFGNRSQTLNSFLATACIIRSLYQS